MTKTFRLAGTTKVSADPRGGYVSFKLTADNGEELEIEAPVEAGNQLHGELGWLVASVLQQQASAMGGGSFNYLQPLTVRDAGAMPSMDGRAVLLFLEAQQSFRIGWALAPQIARQFANGLLEAADKADRVASGKPS